MNPWGLNVFDTASDLAGPPNSGPVKGWIYGIGFAALLIAIGAGRIGSPLLTANAHDMRRWARAMHRRSDLRVSVILPA